SFLNKIPASIRASLEVGASSLHDVATRSVCPSSSPPRSSTLPCYVRSDIRVKRRIRTLLEAARHADGFPGYPVGGIGGQEDDRRRDVARLAEAAERGVTEQPLAKLGAEDSEVVRTFRLGGAGVDRVDSDVARAKLDGEHAGHRVERGLGR